MDMWKPKALSALTQWFPGLLDDSALIYNKVEATGRWPSAMLLAYTSLMPKDASQVEPKATDCWSIQVMVYIPKPRTQSPRYNNTVPAFCGLCGG